MFWHLHGTTQRETAPIGVARVPALPAPTGEPERHFTIFERPRDVEFGLPFMASRCPVMRPWHANWSPVVL